MVLLIAAEMNGLRFQAVHGADVPHRAAAGAHQDRMRDRFRPNQFDTGQQRTVADAGRAEDCTIPFHHVVHRVNAVQFVRSDLSDQTLSFLVIARPHLQLHVATERLERC